LHTTAGGKDRMTMRSVTTPTIHSAQARGDTVVNTRGFELFARGGFLARGVVYGIIGVLALELALGDGGRATNQQGALATIAHQSFGHVLLIAVAIGLGGYAAWRFSHAALGHGPEASDSKFDRVAALASGVVYAGLCVLAIETLSGSANSQSGNTHKTTAGVLGWPAGTWLVGAAGVAFLGVALYQGYKGISKKFLDDSKTAEMSPGGKRAFTAIGVFGHLARMVVFGMVGYFLVKAALDYSPGQAVGLDGVLARLLRDSYGAVLLGIVATGLIAFALYSICDARYRKI
jgi:hypothetical protein